jgi:hypothetical protein
MKKASLFLTPKSPKGDFYKITLFSKPPLGGRGRMRSQSWPLL